MANHLVASAAIRSAGTETAIVRRAQAGDSVAFEALVEQRLDRTYRLAKAIVGDHWAAEDVTQEAFVQAWRNLPHLREADRFDAWFGRIVVNTARMQLRRRRPVITVSIDDLSRGESGRGEPDPALEAFADADALRRAIDRLGIEQRTILALQYVEDRPVEEIAAILGIPTGTAKWRLHEARAALRRAMETQQ
jgi:RNA polymerase sigma-70 factor (ECF subfamily)